MNGELERIAKTIASMAKDDPSILEKALLEAMRHAINLEHQELRKIIGKISDRSHGDPTESGYAWRGACAAIDGEIMGRPAQNAGNT